MLSFARVRAWPCALLLLAAWGHAAAQGSGRAAAEAWPTKPVHLVVGFPSGASPDLVARIIAEPLSKELGQPVIVDTRTGDSGNLAADFVAKSTDGHTLGVLINGNMTIAKLLNPKVPYDPERDLAPVTLLATAPLVLAVPTGAPGGSKIEDFFVAARNAGSQWSYGTPGQGTVGHIGMELLKTRSNIAPVHVPYSGNPQVVTALVDNKAQLALLPPGLAMAQVKAGKLRAIGVTSVNRSPLAPDVPSLSEGGIKGFNLEIWVALAVPSSMPKATVHRLSSTLVALLQRPDIREQLLQKGWQAAGTTPEGLAKRIGADTNTLGGIILMRGIQAQ